MRRLRLEAEWGFLLSVVSWLFHIASCHMLWLLRTSQLLPGGLCVNGLA